MTDCPQTMLEAARYFADRDVCEDYMRRIKWPDGKITCPSCGATGDRIGEIQTRHMLRCKDCRKQFSHKVGTIFEDSPLGLDKWFVAVWAIANCKNGVSSHELGRAIGVTQKTAWFMLHRIRKAMEIEGEDKFDGPVEADTTYVGGEARNMHAAKRKKKITGRGAVNKSIVHGILQRKTETQCSQVRTAVVGSDGGERLMPEIRKNVKFGAEVYTDTAGAYNDIGLTHWHRSINHSVEYVKGTVHVNGMENFWALFKRTLKGTYVAVAPYHLFRYAAEQAMRFNERKTNDAGRFLHVLAGVLGKRLTYRVLTAEDDAGFMGIQ